jgi:hypothetical protein
VGTPRKYDIPPTPDPDQEKTMTEPDLTTTDDTLTNLSAEARAELREAFAKLETDAARWEPRPCPPR